MKFLLLFLLEKKKMSWDGPPPTSIAGKVGATVFGTALVCTPAIGVGLICSLLSTTNRRKARRLKAQAVLKYKNPQQENNRRAISLGHLVNDSIVDAVLSTGLSFFMVKSAHIYSKTEVNTYGQCAIINGLMTLSSMLSVACGCAAYKSVIRAQNYCRRQKLRQQTTNITNQELIRCSKLIDRCPPHNCKCPNP